MRNFWTLLNWRCVKLWQENTCAGFSVLKKFQAGTKQLYLNETLTQVLSCEFCCVLQNICDRLILLFFSSSFMFYYNEELQHKIICLRKTSLSSTWWGRNLVDTAQSKRVGTYPGKLKLCWKSFKNYLTKTLYFAEQKAGSCCSHFTKNEVFH